VFKYLCAIAQIHKGKYMKKILAVIAASLYLMSPQANAQTITGAGATFPYPVYSKWSEAYQVKTDVQLNYQSIGSSGGIKQIKAATVDFGATDAPLKGDELAATGLVQFPTVLGGVVPIVNVDGIKPGELQLTGEVLADIFLGTITQWNDARIAALNPRVKLPAESITVVHRADGSGTTFIFTDYLNEVSRAWAEKMGKGAAVKWPAASSVGGKGNEGVAANVGRVKNSIGYVEYAYAKKNKMTHTKLQNRDGKYVDPDDLTFSAAAAGADWFSTPGMGISLVNQKGAQAWPITGATFILMYREPKNAKTSQETIKFFDWAFANGGKLAAELDYVPLPRAVTDRIRSDVWTQIKK
jgi:phosphate transport system substrate-binding protein